MKGTLRLPGIIFLLAVMVLTAACSGSAPADAQTEEAAETSSSAQEAGALQDNLVTTKHTAVIGGICLIIMGVLMITGLLNDLSGYLAQAGTNPWIILLVSGAVARLLRLLIKNARLNRSGPYRLNVCMSGKSVSIPAMRDSGNLLHDAVTGLPVIVADKACADRLLRRPINLHDLSALPPGFRLIPGNFEKNFVKYYIISPNMSKRFFPGWRRKACEHRK